MALLVVVLFSTYVFLRSYTDEYIVIVNDLGYKNIDRVKQNETEQIIRVYKTIGNEVIQVVATEGYKSEIITLVAIKDDEVKKVEIISHNETHDYGGYITEKWFLNRMCLPITPKLKIVKVAKVNSNEVVAVTGATISSRAVLEGVNLCIDNYGGIK